MQMAGKAVCLSRGLKISSSRGAEGRRMRKSEVVLLGLLAIAVGGCASRLVAFDASKNPSEIRGIRIHQRVPYVLTKQIDTEKCPRRTEESIVHLPIGDPYDVNFEPAQLAKTEFTVVLADDGGLKQVTLNS